ncbi:MAG: nucleoside triphosphate pyrophosphohydrolase [Magnetococcales bacterium]|nr:nucleoside triphosphate pyrophosphohydrolase [Magnetococcales bacterium]
MIPPSQKSAHELAPSREVVDDGPAQSWQGLLRLMDRLRGPEGCPWDREQTWNSLIPHTIEEAYEVAEAVETGDWRHLRDELGDLLFHVVFYSRIGREQNLFDMEDVVRGVTEKMIRRHPHVFGTRDRDIGAGEVPRRWEEIKRQEKMAQAVDGKKIPSIFDDRDHRLPALLWAAKVQRKMAQVGFDWSELRGVIGKVREELDELEQGVSRDDRANIEEELGDVLFTMVNLARHLKVNPETALRAATRKFQNRFRFMEERLHREGRHPNATPLEELEALWLESKKHCP